MIELDAAVRHKLDELLSKIGPMRHMTLGNVDELVRQVAQLVAEHYEKWRGIDSAPHMQKLLVAYQNALGKWRIVKACFYEAETLPMSDCDDEFAFPGWYEESETHEDILLLDKVPTHWRPLPPPPGALSRTGEG